MPDALHAALAQQRNQALDALAVLSVELEATKAERDALAKELAEKKAPASE